MSDSLPYEKPGPVEGSYSDAISPIEEIIDDARNGRMFILVDHEDRENEGDLVIPAQMATPAAINFMAMHGRGLICLSMTSKRVEQLGLPLMASQNSSRHETAFTVSIEIASGPGAKSSTASKPSAAASRHPVGRCGGLKTSQPTRLVSQPRRISWQMDGRISPSGYVRRLRSCRRIT